MFKRYGLALIASMLLCLGNAEAAEKEIAITIDDLPFVGGGGKPGDLKRSEERFMKIKQYLVENQVPATGFVIGGSIAKSSWDWLVDFHNAGFVLGNHTYSHPSLGSTSANKYIAEIAKTDKILTPLFNGPKYFRYPYLAEGNGEKRRQVQEFLAANQYVIAPVTIDSKDFNFNTQLLAINWRNRAAHLNSLKKRYLDYIWKQTAKVEQREGKNPQAQILLIHSNLLNSHALGDIIQLYKDHGYKFISLSEALEKRQAALMKKLPSSLPSILAVIHHSA